MRHSTSIREAYSEAEKYFLTLIDAAVKNEDNAQCLRFQQLSKINANAYFVLYWGQFEAFINAKSVEIEGEEFEAGLMSKVQVVISPKHEYYDEIDRYYVRRCKLAHGEATVSNALNLPSIFDKFDEIMQTIEIGPLPIGDVFRDLFQQNSGE